MEKIISLINQYGPQVLSSLVLLVVGWWLIKKVIRLSRKAVSKRNFDPSLQHFLLSLVEWVLKIFLFVTVLSQLGVATTSFVAILGAAGLAIGLALQGSLGNFAGGALIMLFKPFQVGDLIEAQGVIGTVKEIQIFVTKLTSPDNKTLIIPNGTLSNGNIINYSQEGKIRVDLIVGIAYDSDVKKARAALLDLMNNHTQVLQDPAPMVGVAELADSSVNLAVRPWVKPDHYWDVYFDILEGAKEVLDSAGVEIPYPHQVVHMYNKDS